MKVAGKGERIGRYAIFDAIASGGMATVHFGRIVGPAGFSRTVAIKRLHPHLATDPSLVAMFLDEARLAARIVHPNVVGILDVVNEGEELFLVMDYVRGDSLSHLLRRAVAAGKPVPPGIVSAIVVGAAHGLHAAHETVDEHGASLQIVHRDVSPQNILVGVDGGPRIVDFGVAKAASRLQSTRDGEVKGKLSYMAPEQLTRQPVDRRADVWALGVVLWELLTGKRLFQSEDALGAVEMVLMAPFDPPSKHADVVAAADEACMRALRRNRDERHATALELALELAKAIPPATAIEVGAWVKELAGDTIESRSRRLREIETTKLGDDGTGVAVLDRMIAIAESPTVVPATANPPMAAPLAETRPPTRRRSLVAGAGGLALVFLALGIGWFRHVRAVEVPAAVDATSASPSASASEARVPPAPTVSSPPSTEVTATASPPRASAVQSSLRRAGTAAHPPPPSTRANPNCDPPYTIDPVTQAHRFKPECVN
jgi:serine/threonine-protein kinase